MSSLPRIFSVKKIAVHKKRKWAHHDPNLDQGPFRSHEPVLTDNRVTYRPFVLLSLGKVFFREFDNGAENRRTRPQRLHFNSNP